MKKKQKEIEDEEIILEEEEKENINEILDKGIKDINENSNLVECGEGTYRVGFDNYSRYELRDQIYNVTDTYIGSDEKSERNDRVLDLDNKVFKEEKISIPEGMERLFIEILSNAGDNSERSSRNGIDPGIIDIKMDNKWITLRNGGIPIPIEMHEKEGIYVPEMIMGVLLTSSNYKKDKDRTGCGRNGYGAKLTNIFSKEFIVEIGDPHNKLHYKQKWTENMKNREEPIITDYNGKSFVQISFLLDFERFGYSEYPEEAFRLYARHVIDVSFTCKVPVSFNGNKYNVLKIKDYAKLYMNSNNFKSLVFYEWDQGVEVINKGEVLHSVEPRKIPKIELCALDTPDSSVIVAFANGIMNKSGGVHAEAAFSAVSKSILKYVNGSRDKEKNVTKLGVQDIKKHVSIIISVRVANPTFKGQYKESLTGPKINIKIPDKLLEGMKKWDLVERLYIEMEAKMFKNVMKTDGKKGRNIRVAKYEKANKSGSKDFDKCTLCICEGDSAANYIDGMISSYGDKGRDYYGSFPLKGKPLNVRNAPKDKIYKNEELKNIKKILGLRDGVDYSDDKEFETLNYGNLLIMADSDVDGKHIVGLVINMFEYLYPSLLQRGFVKYLRTPIMRGYNGKKTVKFYTQNQYDTWSQNNSLSGWEWKYLKGLGSSNDDEVDDDSNDRVDVSCIYDEQAPRTLRLAFHTNYVTERKEWIDTWMPNYQVEEMIEQPISDFVNHELIQFSICDIKRSLPSMIDGLKVSQRKIIFGAMDYWGKQTGKPKSKSLKTAILATHISLKTNYHHGPKSLSSAIISMAQDFVGTNNLPYFVRDGQFGNRKGRPPADPRYSSTRPEWWWPLIFKEEDVPLYKYFKEEGGEWEPETFYPVLPIHLINGCVGIGTAHSTWLPSHNPLDISNWFIARLKHEELPKIKPWYRDFTGQIFVSSRSRRKNPKYDEPEPEIDLELEKLNKALKDDDLLVEKGGMSLITLGKYEVTGKVRKTVTVTELPVGRLSMPYKEWLDYLVEKKEISNYNNYSKKNTIKFEIFGMKDPSIKSLKLQRTFGLSNLVVLDESNKNIPKAIKFATVDDMLEDFYNMRLKIYSLRKDNMLSSIQYNIQLLTEKIRYIKACITNQITFKNQTKKQVYEQMDKLKLDRSFATSVNMLNQTDDSIDELHNNIEKIKKDYENIIQIKPEDLWISDINQFIIAYKKHCK